MLLALVAASMVCSVIAKADWKEADPAEGMLRMGVGDGAPDRYWIREDEHWQTTFRCENGVWEFLGATTPFKAEASFCWSDGMSPWEGGAGYTDVESGRFFDYFYETDKASSKTKGASGPIIETVVGTISTHAFDIRGDRSGDAFRQCMGFSVAWDRGYGLVRSLYGRVLHFYACGTAHFSMSEWALRRVLSGFSIEGEFEGLVE